MNAFEKVKDLYENLGSDRPFWAVLSTDEYIGDAIDTQRFFKTGKDEVSRILKRTSELGCNVRRDVALDFGCGLGRVTNALADHFKCVIGVDVSSTMIGKAKSLIDKENIRFAINETPDLSAFHDEAFDFIYSSITLQHIPHPAAQNYVGDFVRILRGDGVCVFMVPDEWHLEEDSVPWSVRKYFRETVRPLFKKVRGKPPVQIHPLSRKTIERVVHTNGGSIMHLEEDPRYVRGTRKHKPLYYWVTKAMQPRP